MTEIEASSAETERQQRHRVSEESLCTQNDLGDPSKPLLFASVCETQIELTSIKLYFEDIIERSPMKVGPGDVAQESWVNSLLNLLCLCVFVYYVL